jgi:hypothetical protein
MTQPNNSALSAGFDDDELDLDVEGTPQPPQETPREAQHDTVTQPEDAARKPAQIPPKLVEDVQDNPELLRPVARSMAAVNLHNLFLRIQHPATNNADRLSFQAMLNKLGGLDAKEAGPTGGPGFSITINIPQVGADKGHTIEAKATVVDEPKLVESDDT